MQTYMDHFVRMYDCETCFGVQLEHCTEYLVGILANFRRGRVRERCSLHSPLTTLLETHEVLGSSGPVPQTLLKV